MSVSCNTGTAAVESEPAACLLDAILLYGLHTSVHSWALAHFVPFWLHNTHETKGYPQWCGCPQPLAPLVSPGGGLGPRFCATCASASGDFPPWQRRRRRRRRCGPPVGRPRGTSPWCPPALHGLARDREGGYIPTRPAKHHGGGSPLRLLLLSPGPHHVHAPPPYT